MFITFIANNKLKYCDNLPLNSRFKVILVQLFFKILSEIALKVSNQVFF